MFDTIIVGAGLAGLAAGQYLMSHHRSNFLVLECDHQIGGRVGTIDFGGRIFSSGPGWLHGQEENPIYDIIVAMGIPIEKCLHEREASFVWDVKENKDISDVFEEKCIIFDEVYQEVRERLKEVNIRSDESVFDLLGSHSDRFCNQSDLERTVIFASKEIYMGASLKDISGLVELPLDEIYGSDGEKNNFRILDPLGVPKMLNAICETFRSKVKLNCKVVKIIWDTESHVVTVVTSDGKELQSRNVIVTLSSNLLSQNAIEFEPPLSPPKSLAWKYVPSVNYCRIFAKFPHRFWPPKEWLIPVIEHVDPFDELILWQNCSKQNLCLEDDNILICHYTSGYNRGASRFDVDKEILVELVTNSMKQMFPSTFCKPDDVRFVSHWNNERFSGSFSICAPGFDEHMAEVLCQSVGPLHFAGESVSVELMGTMQAAYVTGRRAAKFTMS